MIKSIILNFFFILGIFLSGCDGSGGLPRQDDNNKPSTPSVVISDIPSAISSGSTFTLTGTAWDRVGDVTGVT
ncbi:hypothetical protein, partial [Vibrio lentus]